MAKYAAEKIESETADAFNIDVGATWRPNHYLTIGVAVKNLGDKPKFRNEEIDLPVVTSAGVGLTFNRTAVGCDISFPRDSETKVNFGVERFLADFLALRAGYKFGYDEENLTFGLGFSKNIWRVDYAFVPYESGLGSSHRFALMVYWK